MRVIRYPVAALIAAGGKKRIEKGKNMPRMVDIEIKLNKNNFFPPSKPDSKREKVPLGLTKKVR